ncbi:DUF268 domain-containing protein [bacterium]|nr:DUF268 domain-containing protein [bacterium]
MHKFLSAIFFTLPLLCANSSQKIPKDQIGAFARGAPYSDHHANLSRLDKVVNDYTEEAIDMHLANIDARQMNIYAKTDIWLSLALAKYRDNIEGKEVAVWYDLQPWYCAFVLTYGGIPTAFDKFTDDIDPRVNVLTPEQFIANPKRFDAIIAVSFLEHEGLGRYGEPQNKNGDLIAMQVFKNMLKKDGLLFIAVPVCKDHLAGNVYRTYGEKLLPELLSGWKVLNSFGHQKSDFKRKHKKGVHHKPIFVLSPN